MPLLHLWDTHILRTRIEKCFFLLFELSKLLCLVHVDRILTQVSMTLHVASCLKTVHGVLHYVLECETVRYSV